MFHCVLFTKKHFSQSQRDNDIDFYSKATTSTISMDNLSFDAILLTIAVQCDEADKKTLHSFAISEAFLQTAFTHGTPALSLANSTICVTRPKGESMEESS